MTTGLAALELLQLKHLLAASAGQAAYLLVLVEWLLWLVAERCWSKLNFAAPLLTAHSDYTALSGPTTLILRAEFT